MIQPYHTTLSYMPRPYDTTIQTIIHATTPSMPRSEPNRSEPIEDTYPPTLSSVVWTYWMRAGGHMQSSVQRRRTKNNTGQNI